MRHYYRRNPYWFRRNPWNEDDVERFNKKCARSVACRHQWKSIANSTLASTGGEARAIRAASGVVKKRGLTRRRLRRNPFSYLRNPHLEYPCDFCKVEEAEDGCHQCEVRWCFGCRYEHKCSYEIQRRYNPWGRNPSEKDDMKLINQTLDNMTPCDKKDWGLARFYYRNPYRRFSRRYYR